MRITSSDAYIGISCGKFQGEEIDSGLKDSPYDDKCSDRAYRDGGYLYNIMDEFHHLIKLNHLENKTKINISERL
jgi:hypothetical protein